MGQYNSIKRKYPDAVLLFRVGDFYETFGRDAVITAQVLGIVLTKRHNGSASEVELAGFPHHSLDNYLPKLVKAGHRVAICDQLEDPKLTKTIVKRGVTEMVTPGVTLSDKILDHKENNYLASVYFGKEKHGIAFIDVSTGIFEVSEGDLPHIEKLMQGYRPTEVIYPSPYHKFFKEKLGHNYCTYGLDDWVYAEDYALENLNQQLKTTTLKGFGLDSSSPVLKACGAVLHYLNITEHSGLKHISTISWIETEQYMWIDRFTARNLELLYSVHPNGTPLIKVLDQTITPMGARLLRRWLSFPLKTKSEVDRRLDMVETFIKETDWSDQVYDLLKKISDLERLVSKLAAAKISPKEFLHLRNSLAVVPELILLLSKLKDSHLSHFAQNLSDLSPLTDYISNCIDEQAPALLNKGGVIKKGFCPELDELLYLISNGKEMLATLQNEEAEKTGISSLKIAYNNVFGYYLEVRNTHKDRVPDNWIRKQTLVNAERYITPELKELEDKILHAEERIAALEQKHFNELIQFAQGYIPEIQKNARTIAEIDCLLSFRTVALKNHYRKPVISDDNVLNIRQGRHPVIEYCLPPGESYIPNDVYLDADCQQIIIITGPNMSGKSALLRQTALIVIMAQMGCFVPVEDAVIGITEKVFTRVGASDNISGGESTFMVEMIETAGIINNISPRSLVLLDEIGRGTSTYDGISIAWSLVEFLHENPKAQPKTMFATHYHELNELANQFPRVKNFHVSTQESGNKVIFLRKLVEGGSHHSFGIHVAQMAGLPASLIDRAKEILVELESKSISNDISDKLSRVPPKNYQLSIFDVSDPQLAELKTKLEALDINTLTPVEALLRLSELKRMLK